MTPTQRAAIELAIADFEHISAAGGRVEFVERRIAALRAALAETAPVQEPEHYTVDAVAWEGFLHDYGKYVDGHVKYPFSAVRESLAAVIDSAEAAQPRKAVKLNPSDIDMLSFSYFGHHPVASMTHAYRAFAQQIEAAVWAKLGVTE